MPAPGDRGQKSLPVAREPSFISAREPRNTRSQRKSAGMLTPIVRAQWRSHHSSPQAPMISSLPMPCTLHKHPPQWPLWATRSFSPHEDFKKWNGDFQVWQRDLGRKKKWSKLWWNLLCDMTGINRPCQAVVSPQRHALIPWESAMNLLVGCDRAEIKLPRDWPKQL